VYRELLPDRLKNLWQSVEEGLLSPEEFHECQELYTLEYRREWQDALLLNGFSDFRTSILSEIGAYTGNPDLKGVETLCLHALARVKGEWHEKVAGTDKESVELFYNQSQGMLYELMWWHTLIEDLSPLAYVVALHFARLHGCGNYLDFGCGVGSGGLLFAKSGIKATLADISSAALDFSSWRFSQRGLSARHIDLKECALPENSFDFITAMDVFEHLVQPEKTVHDLRKALRPGGFLFGRFHAEADEDRPHHITLDFGPTLATLTSLGFSRVWQDRWLWGHEVFRLDSVF
jgi:SAM-dependent methyltransferase